MWIYSQDFPSPEDEPFVGHVTSQVGDFYLQRGYGPELNIVFFPDPQSGSSRKEFGVVAVFSYEPDNGMVGFAEALAAAQKFLRAAAAEKKAPKGFVRRTALTGPFGMRAHGNLRIRAEARYWGEYGCPDRGAFIVKPGSYPATGVYRGGSLTEVFVAVLGHWETTGATDWHTLRFPDWKVPAPIAEPKEYELGQPRLEAA